MDAHFTTVPLRPCYYHQTTFLQLNTFWFLLHFPNPLILSELPGSGRNDYKFMFEFLFEDILPIIHCNSMQKVLDRPFCNLWQHAEPPNSKSDDSLPKKFHVAFRWNRNKNTFCTFMEWRMKILVAAMSYAPPSSKVIEFRQLCSDVSRDSHIAYRMSNKVVLI